MKAFLICSISLLVLGLSLLPCCAPELSGRADTAMISVDACCADACAADKNPEEGETPGMCSPFFTCGSCSGFTLQFAGFNLNAAPVYNAEPACIAQTQVYRGYCGKKWQPPKHC